MDMSTALWDNALDISYTIPKYLIWKLVYPAGMKRVRNFLSGVLRFQHLQFMLLL